VLATAKQADVLLAYDGETGETIRRLGRSGSAAGELRRPNGIAVTGDVALVVERDNGRVQAFRLPDFEPLGTFGGNQLVLPYGIAIGGELASGLDVFVTDDAPLDSARTRADSTAILTARIRHYRVTFGGGAVEARLVRAFGDSAGPGRLEKVETIAYDPDHGRLLVVDETARAIRVFTNHGGFTGTTAGAGVFAADPEGIALYRCGGSGYWIATEQLDDRSVFHVLDRESFAHRGAFRGETVANTDGVALVQDSMGAATFYAVHDDRGIGAFAWSDVTAALGLGRCVDK
jgi:3-phytase